MPYVEEEEEEEEEEEVANCTLGRRRIARQLNNRLSSFFSPS